MTAHDLLTAALEYHAKQCPVIPVASDKRPLTEWGRWQQQTQTESEVRALPWERAHGIGLLTWPGSRLVVLDFDGPHAVEAWKQTGIPLPKTAANRTRSGGLHCIYVVPPDTPQHPGTNGSDLRRKVRLVGGGDCGCPRACGVDLLVNGFFIAPPTPGYCENPDFPFEPSHLATIPQAVLGLARSREHATARTTEASDGWFASAMLGPVPEGQRNDTATRLAGLLLVKGLTAAQTESLLTPWAQGVCVPAMDPQELRATVQSVARREGTKRHSAGPPEGRFTKGLSELLTAPDEPVAYLMERLLVAASNGFIGGEPKSLKSWLALYLALCLAVGVPAFGRYSVPAPVRVLYFQEEDGERRVRRRVRRLLKAMGAEPPSDSVFRYSIKAGLLLDDDQWMEALRAELAAYRPAVVFADVFELMHSKDSDRRAELKPILYRLDRLREEFQCGFVLVDHFKKASFGISRRGGQRLAGTVGKHAWGECSLYLFPGQGKNQVRVETELKDGPSEAFGLTLEDTPEGGVAFRWEPEATDRAAEMKAKILEAVEGLASPEGWVTAKQVAEAAGVSGNTASKWLTVLADEDGKLVREKQQVGKTKAFHYRLRA